ncbi:hypothetical protein FOCC_FOCC000865 [Frankliniella occidentalis]|nr:hypothetical protein FOCC_FOCC000865 [Frankliniella occidentalis]
MYPDVDFPVPRGTQSVAPLVLWDHDESTNSDIMHLMDNWSQSGGHLNVMYHAKIIGSRIFPLSEELDILVKKWMDVSPNDDRNLEAHFMQGTTETQLVYIENDKPRTALRGHTKVTVSGTEEEPPALPALELEDDAIELAYDDVYQELGARGLEYTDKYKTIKSLRMGQRDWLASVAPNGSLSAAIEAVLQVYTLRAIDESQELRLPSKIRRLDIDIAKLKNKTEVSLRLELATGILVGAGVYASGVTLQEPLPELRVEPLPSTPAPAMQVHKPCALSTALAASSLGGVRLQFLGVTPLSRGLDVGPPHLDYVGVLQRGAEAVRVMGVGRWLPDDRVPHLDPVLRWPVPASWSTRDAATVPFVYALVYHALQVQAGARRGESILVHEGASAVGQAAIRVACQLGCAPLYTTVASSRERAALLAMFPQLQPAQVLSCGDGGSFEPRLRLLTRGRGVRLVVNTLAGSEFRASLRCIGYFGRLVNFSRDTFQEGSIGSQMFLLGSAVFGCSGSELFHATEDTRLLVVEAVAKGIRDGVVQPIVGAEDYNRPRSIGDLMRGSKAVVKVDSTALEAGRVCDANKCYIVVGCQAVDALFLASRLAVLGARHILAVVGSSPSSPLVRQRQSALRRQFGAVLQVLQVREWTPAAADGVVKTASSVAPVHSAVVVAKNEKEQMVAALVSGALQPTMGLVLLVDREYLAAPLTILAEQRQALGRRTSCLAATLAEASDHLGDLLHNSSIRVLPSAIADLGTGADKDLSLSLTADALATLGSDDSQRARRPRMVELASLGPPSHLMRENSNLNEMYTKHNKGTTNKKGRQDE